MTNVIQNLKQLILGLINNENYINYISIIVVALTTYQVTKYNASKPNKLKVKQLQLENIYLPLFRLFENIPSDISKADAIFLILKKITNILDNNYILAFPQLHKLNLILKQNILSNENYSETLRIMKHNDGRIRDKKILIREGMPSTQKACVLAEELGHYYTTVGDILDQSNIDNRKQERKARLWSFNKAIGLSGLVNAYKANCYSLYDIAEYLDVSEDFLQEALECYRQVYRT